MPLVVNFEEDYRKSRVVNISNDSFTESFVFYLYGNLIEESGVDATYGIDDDIVAVKAAYTIIPAFRTMPLFDGENIVLTLNELSLEMIAYDHWKIEVSYGLPNDGGQSGGGYNQNINNVGPNVGDYQNWSQNLVQLEFNVTAEQSGRKMGLSTLACQKNVAATNPLVPYAAGKPAPIGMTKNGIEGANVYLRQFEFGISVPMPASKLTFPYIRRLYRMSTTLNNTIFFGFPAGSVLFLEASASGDVYSVVPVSFNFKVRPNFKFSQAGPTVLMDPNQDNPALMFDIYHEPYFPDADAGPEPGGSFSGWSEVDYLYSEKPDNGLLVQEPYLRTIHQIYGKSNFARFEL